MIDYDYYQKVICVDTDALSAQPRSVGTFGLRNLRDTETEKCKNRNVKSKSV